MQEIPWPLTKKKKKVLRLCLKFVVVNFTIFFVLFMPVIEKQQKLNTGMKSQNLKSLPRTFWESSCSSSCSSSIFRVRLGCYYIFILKRWTSGLWNIANKSGAGFRLAQNDAAALLPTPAPKDQVRLWHCSTALRIASNLNYKALADTPRGTLLWMLRLRRRSGLVSWLFSIIKRCPVAVKRCRRWLSSCCWGQSPCPPWDGSVRLLQVEVAIQGTSRWCSRTWNGLSRFWRAVELLRLLYSKWLLCAALSLSSFVSLPSRGVQMQIGYSGSILHYFALRI